MNLEKSPIIEAQIALDKERQAAWAYLLQLEHVREEHHSSQGIREAYATLKNALVQVRGLRNSPAMLIRGHGIGLFAVECLWFDALQQKQTDTFNLKVLTLL